MDWIAKVTGCFCFVLRQLPTLHCTVMGFALVGNPTNHSSTTVSDSPSCLSAHFFNHMRFGKSN